MYFPEIKQKAIELRKEGYSYDDIIARVPVAKSTLSDWVRDIPYTPNAYTLKKIGNARVASGKFRHSLKLKSEKDAENEVRNKLDSLTERDILMFGLGLYTGEGSKTVGITRMVNSDPKIIRFALKWWKTAFGIHMKHIRIRLHIYPDNDEKKAIAYWSKETGIPEAQFFKASVDKRINKKKEHHGKLIHGTAHVTVKSMGEKKFGIYLHRLTMAWINQILC